MGEEEYYPLFETKRAKGRVIYIIFSLSLFVGICFIWVYRVSHIPREGEDGKWAWIGLLCAELWFGLYWLLRHPFRWNPVFRKPFRHTLSQRYEKILPRVDIFVCTADPVIEPPMMVMNTVLSVMAYDYPREKMSVYLSDDAGSDITFYAIFEASIFATHWLPFCKKFKVEPTSPAAYFKTIASSTYPNNHVKEFVAIQKLYQDMESRIENAAKVGQVPKEVHSKHKGFSQWDSYSSRRDHDTILQILLHDKDSSAKDVDGHVMPTLVYLAREKRPQVAHNFKAGAMNSLVIRVSSMISNGEIILNVDCDMYSNNSQSLRDALCFFMDEVKGHEIAFVQTPQCFENVTKNDLYGAGMRVNYELEFHGMDGLGGPMYIGTGCFHRREILCGRKFNDQYKNDWNGYKNIDHMKEANLHELEEKSKALASCTYEENTLWGKEVTFSLSPYMGLQYGCSVEDVITGLSIKCRGWKSVYYNPQRSAFLGVALTTLPETLIQHKRWSEGGFQIVLSKYSPAWYACGFISPGLQMAYCYYNLWVLLSWPTLYYCIIPSLYLLKGIPLFPQISSPWFIPFAYVTLGDSSYDLLEFLWLGGTLKGWWNNTRMWLYKRTTSYLFAFVDNILKFLGFSESAFVISAKVAEENVFQRYEKEVMEFGNSSPMLTLLATLALLNLFCLLGMLLKQVFISEGGLRICETMTLQVLLSGVLVLINVPVYQGLYLRKDKGRLPISVAVKSTALALMIEMKLGLSNFATAVVIFSSLNTVLGIRFVIDRYECFSHNVQYEGDRVHASFVVIKVDTSWQYTHDGVDLSVKGPSGEPIRDFHDRTSEIFEFVARSNGPYRFCFTNKSPYHETIDFDVHSNHVQFTDQHAKDGEPYIVKLEQALFNIQYEQHWLEAQTERQAIVSNAMSSRAFHKALLESAALMGASAIQVYLLRRLFERKMLAV
ncbi:Cellulose synthase-like protein E1 [Mucuna pruriens]|uniref:Cellulose synthase-like protein E1 n=1 Tax=Mucuna pruriens TaxID=157652 RepID=A0A371E6H8_MUCPR|nr:Cellulose synthase-like protein E1 [Mucuna pruriens]